VRQAGRTSSAQSANLNTLVTGSGLHATNTVGLVVPRGGWRATSRRETTRRQGGTGSSIQYLKIFPYWTGHRDQYPPRSRARWDAETGSSKAGLPSLRDEERLIANYPCRVESRGNCRVLGKNAPKDHRYGNVCRAPWQPGRVCWKPGWRSCVRRDNVGVEFALVELCLKVSFASNDGVGNHSIIVAH
jgi:hypothetical protein